MWRLPGNEALRPSTPRSREPSYATTRLIPWRPHLVSFKLPQAWVASTAGAQVPIPQISIPRTVAYLCGTEVLFLEACCKGLVLEVNKLRWDTSSPNRRSAGSWTPECDIDGIWRLVHLSDMLMMSEHELNMTDSLEFASRADMLFFFDQFRKLCARDYTFSNDYSFHVVHFFGPSSFEPAPMVPEPSPHFLKARCHFGEAWITVGWTEAEDLLLFTLVFDLRWLNRWIFEYGLFRDDDVPPTPANSNLQLRACYPFDHSLELQVVGESAFSCLVDVNSPVARLVLQRAELPLLFRHWRPRGPNRVMLLTTVCDEDE